MTWSQQLARERVERALGQARPAHRPFLEEFRDWLREERHLEPISIALRLRFGRELLVAIAANKDIDTALSKLAPADVETVFAREVADCCIATRRVVASSLRALLRFAAARRLVGTELAESVPSVYQRRLESVPVGIGADDIDRILASWTPDSATKCRDRAVLLLLATYGIRTGQVVELRLGDLEWRERRVTFCAQKRSRAVKHRLTPAVAEAISHYLRRYRPAVEHDHVFVRRRRPLTPLIPPTVRAIVRRRASEAGVEGGTIAPRAFRRALATRLLDARHPMKLIADVLGHESLSTTAIYAKVNFPFLVEAAAEWPAVGR